MRIRKMTIRFPDSMPIEPKTEFGLHESECAGCGGICRVGDLGLCEDCSEKLERDLIRERDWAYCTTVYGMSDQQRENVRAQIVRKFGNALELIAPMGNAKPKRKRRKGRS